MLKNEATIILCCAKQDGNTANWNVQIPIHFIRATVPIPNIGIIITIVYGKEVMGEREREYVSRAKCKHLEGKVQQCYQTHLYQFIEWAN